MTPDIIVKPPTRNLYRYGLLMDADRFQKDQDHCNEQRHLLNRFATGAGVLCGLALSFNAATEVLSLNPGIAIDRAGREIVVPIPTPIDITQLTDAQGKTTGPVPPASTLLISVAYAEKKIDPAPILVPDCDNPNACAPCTIEETFAIIITITSGGPPAPSSCGFGAFPFSTPPGGALQALIANAVAAGFNPVPTDTSIPLGRLAPGGALDAVSDRLVVYDNLTLFQLINCLAARVAQISGNVLVYVSGDNQSGPAGKVLVNPLVVALLDNSGGPLVSATTPTFTVTSGGGSIGPVTLASPGQFQASWTTGFAGPQQVTVKSSDSNLTVLFNATIAP
jgi:hypothetical protein